MPSDNKSLAGKVAWITGGGSGIGLAAGLELARAGAHVVLSGRSAETLKKAQKEVEAETLVLDVADRKQVAAAAQKILKQHGGIDILVNSAGINLPQRNFRNVSVEGWDQIVAINLSGTRNGSRVKVTGQVVVSDAANAVVPGVSVNVTWRKPDGTSVAQTAITGSNGTASFNTSGGRGTYTLTVTNLARTGYVFDAANSVLTGSITK